MIILAIETSCDETSIALVECSGGLRAPKFNIIKNIVSSQIPIHRPFGGVVPNLAKREHIKNLPLVLRQVFANPKSEIRNSKQIRNSKSKNFSQLPIANYQLPAIDMIAVTVGPGLEPALWTGIEFAKTLIDADKNADKRRSKSIRVNLRNHPRKSAMLVGVNHLKGHLYSFLGKPINQLTNQPINFLFPAIALLVSGGHTLLLKLDSLTKWKKLGETRDDAAGEAFDKVARMMNLPYPGGPEISKLAALRQAQGKKKELINFPRPMMHDKSYDFSFSGLKTAVLYYLRDHKPQINADKTQIFADSAQTHLRRSVPHQRESADAADVAASFQQAVVDVLTHKTMRAAQEFGARSIILCGGVAANKALRANLRRTTNDLRLNFFVPPNDLNGDNAAMIAMAAYIDHLKKARKLKMEARGNLNI